MPRPLSTCEVGGVNRRSLTEVDLHSWPTLSRPGVNPQTEGKIKLKCTISVFPALPLRVGEWWEELTERSSNCVLKSMSLS